MLTPAFELTQNEEFLFVSIQVPYAKISEVEVEFEEHTFMFYSKPYYLKLNLPGKVLYQENPSVKYDIDKRTFTIKAPKAEKGEVFEGLDLITQLLPKKKGRTAPLIEVLEGSDETEECEEFDWTIDLEPSKDQFGAMTFTGQQCGFGCSYSYSVFDLEEECVELFEVTEPQKKSPQTRREERIAKEESQFNEDHYIADLYHDEEIQNLVNQPCQWNDIYEEIHGNLPESPDDKISFTHEEKERLRKLPNKEYLLDKDQKKSALLGLVDILFAYAYNKRITEGENTVMSAWAINRISATLSWLEVFTSVQDVAITCLRRSLIYPLFRHFELSLTVLEDVIKLLKLGRKYVMKCLLETHELFCENEPRYILNDLYITDYNVWIQSKSCSSKTLLSLALVLEKMLITKGDIGLSLVDIESIAAMAWIRSNGGQSENSNESTLCSELGNLSLTNTAVGNDTNEEPCSSDDEYSCSCTSTSSDSSTNDSNSSEDSDDVESSSESDDVESSSESDDVESSSESDDDIDTYSDSKNSAVEKCLLTSDKPHKFFL